jgi:branched-subunit amino acid transport protein
VSPYLVVLAAGVASYACRLSMVALGHRTGTPALLERAAPFVVPVTFAAVAAGGVVAGTGSAAPVASRSVAVVVAVVAVRRTGRAHAAVAAGMPTLWALNALLTGG